MVDKQTQVLYDALVQLTSRKPPTDSTLEGAVLIGHQTTPIQSARLSPAAEVPLAEVQSTTPERKQFKDDVLMDG